MQVIVLPSDEVRPPQVMFNPEEGLQRGYYLELERFLNQIPAAELDKSAADLSLYGKVLLARGDYERGWRILERARNLESRTSRRAEIEWELAQGAILWNDFASAHDYAQDAVHDGYGLVPGFVRFLAAMRDVDVCAGARIGESHAADFDMRRFNLIRLQATVNAVATDAILDTGAVYSIVSESFATKAGVRRIPDSNAKGRGFHKKDFPVTFGVLDHLEFAGFTLRDVPVMLMPDDALLFETSRGTFPVPAVIGLHLLKEFTVELDYRSRRLTMTRQEFRTAKSDPDQDLFLHRGRLFVRTSINRDGYYPFLFDTGSEPTMLTLAGLARSGLKSWSTLSPKKVAGIGQTRMEWQRVGKVTLGVAGFGVRFHDLVVQDTESHAESEVIGGSFEDGVIGTSFLENFRVRIDFSRMILRLENNS